jgi:hypothetical protein
VVVKGVGKGDEGVGEETRRAWEQWRNKVESGLTPEHEFSLHAVLLDYHVLSEMKITHSWPWPKG